MRILLTGAEGFAGSHLRTCLESRGHEVVATTRDGRDGLLLDLPDDVAARRLVEKASPDALIHLAAITSVPQAAADPAAAWQVNLDGTRSLLSSVLDVAPGCRFLYVSTGVVYGGEARGSRAIDEARGLAPQGPYAWTKVAAEALIRAHEALLPGGAVIARPFNHTGPGQSSDFALSSFARQIAMIERGGAEPTLRVGNLLSRRDFLDVRDVVKAYALIIEEKEATGTFNVSSGRCHSMKELLEMLIELSGVEVCVEEDASRVRGQDIDSPPGDSSRLRQVTGWTPRIPIEGTLADLLEDWRARLPLETTT